MMLSMPMSPDPVFVGSAYLRESLPTGNPEGDDDKVYFFFSEMGKEFDYFENTIVSRIARVCKVGLGHWGCQGLLPRVSITTGMGRGMWDYPVDLHPWIPEHPRRKSAPLGDCSCSKCPAQGCGLSQLLTLATLVAEAFPTSSVLSPEGTQTSSFSWVMFPFPWVPWRLLCLCLPKAGAAL